MVRDEQKSSGGINLSRLLERITARDAIEGIGLGLFFCWLWSSMQNPTVPSVQQYPESIHFSHWVIILASSVITIIALIIEREARRRMPSLPSLKYGAVILLVIYALVAYFPVLAGISTSIHNMATTITTGMLAAWMLVAWGSQLSRQGPRRLISLSTFSLTLAFVIAIAVNELPPQVTEIVISLFPIVSTAILLRSEFDQSAPTAEPAQDSNSLLPKKSSYKFFATLFVQGMAFGLLHFLYGTVEFEQCNDPYCPLRHIQPLFPISVQDFYGFAGVVGLVLASIIVLIAIKALRLNFRKLLYVVGFPLAALGFLIIGSDEGLKDASTISHASGLNFVYGEIVFVAGYYYIVVLAWALCAHLTRLGKEDRKAAYTWSALSLFGGQLGGFALSAASVSAHLSRSNMCFLALFTLMLASLLIATNDSLWAEWGNARPDDSDRTGIFKRACQSVSEMYALTPREAEILLILARGRSMAHVAEALVISKDTVKTHCRSIYRKLQVHSQQEVIDLVEAEINVSRDQRTS